MPYIPRFSRAFSFGVYGGLRNPDAVSYGVDTELTGNAIGSLSAGYLACLAEVGGDASKVLLCTKLIPDYNIGTGTTVHNVRGWDGSASAANPAAGRGTLSGGAAWTAGVGILFDGVDDFLTFPQPACTKTNQTLIFRFRNLAGTLTAAAQSTIFEQYKTGVVSGTDANTWVLDCFATNNKVGIYCNSEGNLQELTVSGTTHDYALLLSPTSATFYDLTNDTSISETLTSSASRTCDGLRVACGSLDDGSHYGFSAVRCGWVVDINAILTIQQCKNIMNAMNLS